MSTHSPDLGWTEKRALIIGRASPEPSKQHLETVCTGGITEEGQLLRLYPIPLRYLQEQQKYKLWSWAKFDVQKNPVDRRKESYRVRDESIVVESEIESWAERFSLLQKAIVQDRETLEEMYKRDWTSMGIVQIELVDFEAAKQRKNWEEDKPYIKQFHMYTEVKPLEQLPIELRLKFRCTNNRNCRTHVSTLIGWEYMEAFRKFRSKYGTGAAAFARMKEGINKRFSDPNKDAFVLMGTHFKYPSWMVAQLYFFDKNLPRRLF